MDPLTLAAVLIGGLAMLPPKRPKVPAAPSAEVLQFIVSAARATGVPVHVALAFADLESGLNSRAEGDTDWHLRDGGALYQRLVLNNPRLAQNPARFDPPVWHSYGLFQLLAPHHVLAREHPHELLDARTNAQRGCAFIASLLKRSGGDVRRARLAYIGCGLDGERCNAEHVTKVSARLEQALQKWSQHGQGIV